MRTLAAAIIGLLVASPALASHPAYGARSTQVVVHVDPWSPAYRPAPQPDMVWVDGYWDGGFWVPGTWHPTYARAGYSWVPGYWNGVSYSAGYWRPVARPGYSWAGGYYDGRSWVAGYWAPQAHIVHHATPSHRQVVVHRSGPPRAAPARPTGARPAAHGTTRPSSGGRPAARTR
jgi:hypothetical protein